MTFIWLTSYFSGILLLSAFAKQNGTMPVNPVTPISNTQNYSYLALGDSYTIGQNVTEKERFPYLAKELLNNQGIVINDLKYIAQTGWSTIALQNAIAAAQPL